MKLTQFKLKAKDGDDIFGEYEGDISSKRLIVFSHGFGVTRSSHGMFNEIGDELKDNAVVVRFDYVEVNKEKQFTRIKSISNQVEKLNEVIQHFTKHFLPTETIIIAHSMGGLVTSKANLQNITKIFLLACPTEPPYNRMINYFSSRPETVINLDAESTIIRSDGSVTYVEKEFWQEIKDLNPMELFKKVALSYEVIFVRAISDQVLTESEFIKVKDIPKIKYFELQGNHDFEGDSRKILIDFIITNL